MSYTAVTLYLASGIYRGGTIRVTTTTLHREEKMKKALFVLVASLFAGINVAHAGLAINDRGIINGLHYFELYSTYGSFCSGRIYDQILSHPGAAVMYSSCSQVNVAVSPHAVAEVVDGLACTPSSWLVGCGISGAPMTYLLQG